MRSPAKSARVSIRDVDELTPAEMKMLAVFAAVGTYAKVAQALGITYDCVLSRGKSIREKLGVDNMKEAIDVLGDTMPRHYVIDRVQNQPSPWTPELDMALKEQVALGKTVYEISQALSLSEGSVRGRAARLNLKLARAKPRRQGPANKSGEGHRPFTERCGEILRAHGVKI